nr:retrovirus-related Pol polyprotein from transposon TNT 1-94 [Tanacetum cinerariifolium]
EKSSVIRQPNAFKSQRPSVLGKPTTLSNSFIINDFSKSTSVTKNNVSNDFSKPVSAQTLPATKKSCLKNTNVLAPGMYKIRTAHTQTRTSKLPPDSKNTNKSVSFSTGVIPTTSVSRPQLKSNPKGDRVLRNNSHGKKLEVEEHRRNVKLLKNKMSVTACTDSLNAKTVNVKSVSAMCVKCVMTDMYDVCVTKSVTKPLRKTVANESINKPRNNVRKLHERFGKIYKWTYIKFTTSGPQLKSNPMGDRVMHNDSQGKKQDVEDQCRNVKLPKNKTSVTACNDSLNAKTLNVNSVSAMCDKCVLYDKHDMCVLTSVAQPIKKTVASKSNQKPRNITRKLYERVSKTCSWWYPKFTPSGYKWKPKSGKENVNPNVSMPLGNASRTANVIDTMTSRRSTVSNTPLSSNSFATLFGNGQSKNDQIAPILGYGDLVQGAVMIKRVYYVEGLNHNLFSVGQFCDADLEVAFRKSTCFIRDLKGNDLLTDHLCSSCELGKAKRKSFHTKLTPSLKRRLQLLHMDLCGPMRVASINGKRYVLVIVDDYSIDTWTYFLRSKDEIPEVLIDFLKFVQRGLQAQVRVVRTDKGTEFLNQTLRAHFTAKGIHHQTSVARTPEQNGIVKKWNRTLVEAAPIMLSTAKVPLFFWAEAIATACFTQNRSLVIPRHEKTPYHIINDWKPSVKFFYIFGSLCYIVRDGENLDKMKEKEGILHQTFVARTPKQNGVVERQNYTLVEAARTMLNAAKVPLFFWAEAIATACFTQNHSLVIPRHDKTPYHIINDQKPSIKFFHIWLYMLHCQR